MKRGRVDSRTFYIGTGERMRCLNFTVIIAGVVTFIGENCYTYRRKGDVTIDTADCFFVISTQPLTTRGCLDSCTNKTTVSISSATVASQLFI